MEIDLIENLHELSNTVKKIQLEKYNISQLIHIHNYYCIEDFTDTESYVFQNDVLNADDRKISLILKNFDKAIETNCGNNIDLEQYSIEDRFEISYSTNTNVKNVSKLYTIKNQFPKDDDLFKCYWLKHFIKECKQIVKNIRSIIEQPNETNNLPTTQMISNQFQYDNFKDLLLVEELEKRLAIEAVEYKTKIDELWQTYTFDPAYFDTFISGELYNVFLNAIYERIKPLNDFEINKYLTLSVNQFKTHTPTKRAETFKRIYHATYWYPNQMEYKANEYDDKYAMHVWKHYTNHFQLFKEATVKALQDFKNGLFGNASKQKLFDKSKVNKNRSLDTTISYEYLNAFCNAISNQDLIFENSFITTYKCAITHYTDYFKNEINQNILNLKLQKRDDYLELLIHKIETTPFFNFDKTLTEVYLNKYVVDVNNFPKELNKELYNLLNTYPNRIDLTPQKQVEVSQIQLSFYAYFSKIEAMKMVDFIISKKKSNLNSNILVQPSIKKIKSKHHSFTYKKWQFESTNLTSLKDSLIRKKLIASDTDLKDFRKAFSGEEIEKPIVWTGNISELSYFIKKLHNELKLVEDLKQQQWAVTINCFIQENGEQYNRTKLRTQKVPATSKNIDMALKTL